MTSLHAVLVGLVEGLTEYLPVSANAHVLLLGRFLGEDPVATRSLGVCLQAAPALAVLLLYRERFLNLFRPAPLGGVAFAGARAWKLLALVTFPVLVVGVVFKPYFYALMLGPGPSVAGLALGGLALLWAESRPHRREVASLDAVTYAQALGVGLFQCLALWPGVSRSGATIVGGLLLGLDRRCAAEFSFLAGVPVLLAAAGLELRHAELLRSQPGAFALAFGVALLCALLSVRELMRVLARVSFRPFGIYRLAFSPLLWVFFRG